MYRECDGVRIRIEAESISMDDEPVILAFLLSLLRVCCGGPGRVDAAASIPGNVRVLRLPCTGKLEVNYLLAAFERGVDGVIVAGCLEGGCHFLEGNLRARGPSSGPGRSWPRSAWSRSVWRCSTCRPPKGPRFAEIVTTMVERIKRWAQPVAARSDAVEQGVQEMSRQAEAVPAGDKR